MKTVYDLREEELDELKSAYFWQDETQDLLDEGWAFPDEIPDGVVLDYYGDVCFSDDDFFCNSAAT